jgi:hypothetical protein
MPIDRNDVLRPLGGEDNLRLMCDAEDFRYMDWGRGYQVTFSTPKYSVDVVHYPDRLDRSERWVLVVWGKYRVHKIHVSDSILDPDLLVRTFEWATKYTLSF